MTDTTTPLWVSLVVVSSAALVLLAIWLIERAILRRKLAGAEERACMLQHELELRQSAEHNAAERARLEELDADSVARLLSEPGPGRDRPSQK